MSNLIQASGVCEKCGVYDSADGSDEEESDILLFQNHGAEYLHAYTGAIKHKKVQPVEPVMTKKAPTKKRRKR